NYSVLMQLRCWSRGWCRRWAAWATRSTEGRCGRRVVLQLIRQCHHIGAYRFGISFAELVAERDHAVVLQNAVDNDGLEQLWRVQRSRILEVGEETAYTATVAVTAGAVGVVVGLARGQHGCITEVGRWVKRWRGKAD